MKSSEFKALIEKIGAMYETAGSPSQQEQLTKLVPIFELMPAKSVTDLAKCIGSTAARTADSFSTSVEPGLRILEATQSLLVAYGKTTLTKDLSAVVEALKAHRQSEIASLISATSIHLSAKKKSPEPSPIRDDLVRAYIRRLEQALGDDEGFKEEFAKLESDKNIQANEIIVLAKLFTLATVKSRPTALKKILSRHQSIMTSRAKSAATGGRVAG